MTDISKVKPDRLPHKMRSPAGTCGPADDGRSVPGHGGIVSESSHFQVSSNIKNATPCCVFVDTPPTVCDDA
ncbi:hypothetical protein AmDm5_0678 [Acetobacter malorum]|nr:hypothetical protein AmDm5_0678 [Acetobacter malorum]